MKKGSDFRLAHALTNGPHKLGHGGLAGHVPTLDDPQLQKLVAHLVNLQVRAVVETLGGHHHADAVLHRPADAPQAFVEHVYPAQAEGLDDDAPVAHGSQHFKNRGIQPRSQLQKKHILTDFRAQPRLPGLLRQHLRIHHQA